MEKPRLKYISKWRRWMCYSHDGLFVGWGYLPIEAYKDWQFHCELGY